jgi:hypothetical protein
MTGMGFGKLMQVQTKVLKTLLEAEIRKYNTGIYRPMWRRGL